MIKFFEYFIIALFLYAINLGLLKNFLFFGASPNLLFLLVIYISLEEQGQSALFFAFFCGLMLDFAAGVFLGSFSGAFLLVAMVLQRVSFEVVAFERNWKFLPLAVIFSQIGIFGWLVLVNFIELRLGQPPTGFVIKEQAAKFFFEILYNLIFLYPIWKLASLPGKLQTRFSSRTK